MTRTRFAFLVIVPFTLAAGACASDVTAPAAGGDALAFASAASAFTDDFNTWQAGRWSAEEHPLGKGWFRAANVSVSGGILGLRSPAGTTDGGEIASFDRFGSGTFTARMRCAMPAGTLCAFFLYEGVPGNRNDEIDFEVISGTRTLWMTTWSRGVQTNHAEVTLPFDPAVAFHEYTIEYERRSVTFHVDGVQRARFTKRLPKKSMKLLVNTWWPTWLSQPVSPFDTYMEIDRIDAR